MSLMTWDGADRHTGGFGHRAHRHHKEIFTECATFAQVFVQMILCGLVPCLTGATHAALIRATALAKESA